MQESENERFSLCGGKQLLPTQSKEKKNKSFAFYSLKRIDAMDIFFEYWWKKKKKKKTIHLYRLKCVPRSHEWNQQDKKKKMKTKNKFATCQTHTWWYKSLNYYFALIFMDFIWLIHLEPRTPNTPVLIVFFYQFATIECIHEHHTHHTEADARCWSGQMIKIVVSFTARGTNDHIVFYTAYHTLYSPMQNMQMHFYEIVQGKMSWTNCIEFQVFNSYALVSVCVC